MYTFGRFFLDDYLSLNKTIYLVLKWLSTDVRSCLMSRLLNSAQLFISKMTVHKKIIGTHRNNFFFKFDLHHVGLHSFVRCTQRFCDMSILSVLCLTVLVIWHIGKFFMARPSIVQYL